MNLNVAISTVSLSLALLIWTKIVSLFLRAIKASDHCLRIVAMALTTTFLYNSDEIWAAKGYSYMLCHRPKYVFDAGFHRISPAFKLAYLRKSIKHSLVFFGVGCP